jgi:hypothetical protein
MRHYCTYFDSGYLARGLALYESLRLHAGSFVLWILCLDEPSLDLLRKLDLPAVRLIRLRDLEWFYPELLSRKAQRSRVEYYFTLTPFVPAYVLGQGSDSPDEVTYLDADLYFYSSPEPLFEELGSGSVAIIPHRPPDHLESKLRPFGLYNVGWLTFRATAAGTACLEWWQERCLEWCHDRVEDGRFADQAYLDQFPTLFDGVVVLRHPGANLAPWNVARHRLANEMSEVRVDQKRLVFFHFHGISRIGQRLFDTNLARYRARLSSPLRHEIYAPYLSRLIAIESMYGLRIGNAARGNGLWRKPLFRQVGHAIVLLLSLFRGSLVRAERIDVIPFGTPG